MTIKLVYAKNVSEALVCSLGNIIVDAADLFSVGNV